MNINNHISLSLTTDISFISLVKSFAEESSLVFGIEKEYAMRITLAVEEIFCYLCGLDSQPERITIEIEDGIYLVRVGFHIPKRELDLGAFNICSKVSLEDDTVGELGLLIASRFVDNFHLNPLDNGGVEIWLIKEKSYPASEPQKPACAETSRELSIVRPSAEQVKTFAANALFYADIAPCPEDFRFPGKTADMVLSGDHGCLIAVDPIGLIVGGIFWRSSSKRAFEFYGPFVFSASEGLSLGVSLTEMFISEVAKTEAVCIITRTASPWLPRDYFELIGALYETDNTVKKVYFRQLKEDLGCQVWSCDEMSDFLREQYNVLSLPREIVRVQYSGETRPRRSVIKPSFNRKRSSVTLSPVRDGLDIEDNLRLHFSALKKEGLRDLLFEVDLGVPWQAFFMSVLLRNDFKPVLIMPYLGRGDIIVFQHTEHQIGV